MDDNTQMLHLFELGDMETIVASDLEDAWRTWHDETEGGPNDYEDGYDAMEVIPDDRIIAVWVDDDGMPCEHGYGVIKKQSATEWGRQLGRGIAFAGEQ